MPRAPSPPAVGGGFGGSGEQGVAELRPQVLLWVLGGAGPLASRPPSPGASSGVWFPFARRRGAGWEQNRLWLRNTEAYKLQQQGGDGIVVHTAASLLPLACSRVRLVLGAAEARFKARGLLYAVFFPPRHFFGQNHATLWCCSPTGLGGRQVSPRASRRWGTGSIIAAHSRPFTPEGQLLSWEAPHRHFRLHQIP